MSHGRAYKPKVTTRIPGEESDFRNERISVGIEPMADSSSSKRSLMTDCGSSSKTATPCAGSISLKTKTIKRRNDLKLNMSECKQTTPSISISEQRIGTAFSISFLNGILRNISPEKQEIIRSLGLGILLKLMTMQRFPRQLAFWILRNMNSKNGAIVVRNAATLMVSESDVELVMGIPRGHKEVISDCNVYDMYVARLRKLLMLKSGADITLECVENILKRNYVRKMTFRERDAFKVALVLCADAYFLSPRGGKPKINQEIFVNLINTVKIPDMNWCGYVLRSLIQSAGRVQQSLTGGNKTVTMDGCLLFPVVFYLDNVNFGNMTTEKNLLPRILDYPYCVLKMFEKIDRKENNEKGMAEYGRNVLLPDDKVIYSRNKLYKLHVENESRQEIMSEDSTSKGIEMHALVCKLDNWATKVKNLTIETQSKIISYLSRRSVSYSDEESKTRQEQEAGRENMETDRPEKETSTGTVLHNLYDITSSTSSDGENVLLQTTGTRGADEVGTGNMKNNLLNSYDLHQVVPETPIANDIDEVLRTPRIGKKGGISFTILSDQFEDPVKSELKLEVQRRLANLTLTDGDQCEGKQNIVDEQMDCTSPLLLLMPTTEERLVSDEGKEEAEDGRALILNDIKILVQYREKSDRFGISPFAIGMTHPDTTFETQLTIQLGLSEVTNDEMLRTWYMHMCPTTIQIDGKLMRWMLQGNIDFGLSTIDGLVWALQRNLQDTRIDVKEMFLGEHVSYKVIECRLVLVPVLVNWHWTLYVWDWLRKKIVVLDPIDMHQGSSYLETKHSTTLVPMHAGMEDCYNLFFDENNDNIGSWDREYIYINGGEVESKNTGLYTMFYARHFDGEFVTRILTKEATYLQRINLLFQLLTMEGNVGCPPTAIANAKEFQREE